VRASALWHRTSREPVSRGTFPQPSPALVLSIVQGHPDACDGLATKLWRRRVLGHGVFYCGAGACGAGACGAQVLPLAMLFSPNPRPCLPRSLTRSQKSLQRHGSGAIRSSARSGSKPSPTGQMMTSFMASSALTACSRRLAPVCLVAPLFRHVVQRQANQLHQLERIG
jgi:hypothetical protein